MNAMVAISLSLSIANLIGLGFLLVLLAANGADLRRQERTLDRLEEEIGKLEDDVGRRR